MILPLIVVVLQPSLEVAPEREDQSFLKLYLFYNSCN